MYALKYTADFQHGNITYTLNIYQRDLVGATVKKIKNITDLRFGFVGQTTPDEAIAKTQLQLSMVDAPDMEYASDEKGGNWQEFYTQDPTLYKVEVSYDISGRIVNFPIRWTGYITPDSWSEDLVYHGVVSFIARDNIGHLQDFAFKDQFTGDTVTFNQIVTKANELAGQSIYFASSFEAMNIIYQAGTQNLATSAKNATFYTSHFEDKNVYEALEEILTTFGLTLRWFDNNVFGICPVGEMTSDTFGGALIRRSNGLALFYNNSGKHTLNPAYKNISDKITYDFLDEKAEPNFESGVNGSPQTSATGYEGSSLVGDAICMRFSMADNYFLESTVRMPAGCQFNFSIDILGGYYYKNMAYDVLPQSLSYNALAVTARYSIIWRQPNGFQKYLDASSRIWGNSLVINSTTASTANSSKGYTKFELNYVVAPSTTGKLIIRLYSLLGRTDVTDRSFSCLDNISVEYTLNGKTTSETVTTENAPLANIALSRNSEVGQYVGDPDIAQCVENAMLATYMGQIYGVIGMSKSTDNTSIRYQNIWEYCHRQLLCTYLSTTSVLEGEMACEPYYDLFSDTFSYQFANETKTFYLCSGNFNVLTGRIEGAVLREIGNFTDLWTEYTLNGYTIVIEKAESVYDDGTIAYWDGDDVFCRFANQGSQVRITGHIGTSNPKWSKPKLAINLWCEEFDDDIAVTSDDPNNTSGRYPFEIIVDASHSPQPNMSVHADFYNCAIKAADEGGYYYEDITTYGMLNFMLHYEQ